MRGDLMASLDLFLRGFRRFDVVHMFAMRELRHKYRRSVLGVFWVTMSMAIWVGTLAFVFGRVFNSDTEKLLPYMSASIILWTFFAMSLTEACVAFQSNEEYIKSVNLPLSVFIYRIAWSNAIVVLHNILAYALVAMYFSIFLRLNPISIVAGWFLFVANCLWIMFCLALACVRYRDAGPIVANGLQVLFYLTPIIWMPSYIPAEKRSFIEFNPFYHLFEVVRAPLIALPLPMTSVLIAGVMALIGWTLSVFAYARWRKDIVYWL